MVHWPRRVQDNLGVMGEINVYGIMLIVNGRKVEANNLKSLGFDLTYVTKWIKSMDGCTFSQNLLNGFLIN